MPNKEVFMDTNVFTEIVNNIQLSASGCVLKNNSLNKTVTALPGTDVGLEITEILKQLHSTAHTYRAESSQALTPALLTIRDGLINTDESLSKSLEVETIPGGDKQ
ncbi:MAG: hypothetical protein IKZ97_01590 [Butyrivibrio sp.]|nr:hypothetical protein [Butyrivibrio sp.]